MRCGLHTRESPLWQKCPKSEEEHSVFFLYSNKSTRVHYRGGVKWGT